MRQDSGFSLIELLVVIAIVSLVAAVAIPTLINSRMMANEAAAQEGCRAIAAAENAYAAVNQRRYASLATLVSAGLLDSRYSGLKATDGYLFSSGDVAGTEADGPPPASYGFVASPLPGHGRYFYSVGADGKVRYQRAASTFLLPEGVVPGDPVEK